MTVTMWAVVTVLNDGDDDCDHDSEVDDRGQGDDG